MYDQAGQRSADCGLWTLLDDRNMHIGKLAVVPCTLLAKCSKNEAYLLSTFS